jgi:hypothetical protein
MIDAVRALTLGPAGDVLLTATPAVHVARSLAWAMAILAASVLLAMLRYRRM